MERIGLRMLVLRVLVVALVVTLGTRLYYLQVVDKSELTQSANRQHTREVVLPAPRGDIVDDMGRPLADNRQSLVVSVDRSVLAKQPGKGGNVLRRLAKVIHVPSGQLRNEIRLCTKGVKKPCWTGSPVQPVPVATKATNAQVLRISEHREDFRGVVVDAAPVRQYPQDAVAGHEVGYTGAVTQDEIDASASEPGAGLHDEDSVGRSGLEKQYDSYLRGTDGIRTVAVDPTGAATGTVKTQQAKPGDTLVTSLDTSVEKLAQRSLQNELAASRKVYDAKSHKNFVAPTGAVVVMDPDTGRVLALASYPNYDPNVFIGGISQSELAKLSSPSAGTPMVSRAVQGQFAPGSTFKLSTSSAIVMDHQLGLNQTAACPPNLQVGNQKKTNYDSESLSGNITLARALAFSCDTFFYKFAIQGWNSDQKLVDNGKQPVEALQAMARAYGFGSAPGIDLPAGDQTSGQIVDRKFLQQRWDADKKQYCTNAKQGYPTVADKTRRAYLTELAKENCSDGWRFRIGEAADMAIGQGETTVSPLQLATAYSAMVNGGTLYEPTIGKAIVDPHGKVVQTIKPKVRRHVPVSPDVLKYIQQALRFGVNGSVSGEPAFAGYPVSRFPMGGKTGTAEVYGKQDTSWFASWSRAGTQKYVIVGMVEQGGTGARAAAPMVRKVYEGLYGVGGSTKHPVQAALPGGQMPQQLPKITPYADQAPAGDIVGAPPQASATPAGTANVAGPLNGPAAVIRTFSFRQVNRRQRRRPGGPDG
ncbi:MAG TPA: penicillin-binding protein 2 [Mycobacteriales bacterium]|nr:penicillin-binding protein 2 [Mycobacteriales bacterium]